MDAKTAEAFSKITELPHSKQGIWYLNGFWPEEGGDELGEEIWKYVQNFQELENDGPVIKYRGKKAQEMKQYEEGCDLDPHKSHRFLEALGETLTVAALRKKLETIDVDKNKRMCLSEYLLFKFNKTPQELIDAPQGSDQEAVDKAQAKMDAVQAALADVQDRLANVKAEQETVATKLQDVESKLAEQKKLEAENKSALEQLAKAKAELQEALDALKKEEDAYAAKKASLEKIASDPSAGAVKKNKASNELAQLLAEDPMPLRKAKITQGAALKKVEKNEKKAKKAQEALQAAIKESEAAQAELSQAQTDLKKSEEELQESEAQLAKDMEAAEEELNEAKKKGGVAMGAIWWMEKELKEARKYGRRK